MAKDDAFTENEAVESTPRRGKRISLVIGDDGRIDWDRVRPQNKEAFVSAMEGDQHTLDVLGLEPRKTDQPTELQITEDHVKVFIDGYAFLTRIAVPKIVAYQTKGKIVIPPELAARVYVFSDQAKDELTPAGAQWANENLPDWVKEWIAKVGPGTKFFGGLIMTTLAQTQMVIQSLHAQEQKKQPINGQAIDTSIPESAATA